MAAIVKFLQGLAYAAITFVCISVSITVLQVRSELKQLSAKANTSIDTLDSHSNELVNKLYAHATLEMKNFDYLVLNLGETANIARQASIKEMATLDSVNREVTTAGDRVNVALDSANLDAVKAGNTLDSLKTTVEGVQPVLAATTGTLTASTAAIGALDKVVSNPAIPAILANTQDLTASAGATVKTVEGSVDDTADVWHKFLHPTWPHRIFSLITGEALPVAVDVVK